MRQPQIGVAGSGSKEDLPRLMALATDVGQEIAGQGAILVFGGSEKPDHLPNAAYRAAHAKGGIAIAIMEGARRDVFSTERTFVIPCGEQGRGWERAMARPCDALIVIGGRDGTLEEMRTAYENRTCIVALMGTGGMADAWAGKALDDRKLGIVFGASTPKEAVEKAMQSTSKL